MATMELMPEGQEVAGSQTCCVCVCVLPARCAVCYLQAAL